MPDVEKLTKFFKEVEIKDDVNHPAHYNKGGVGCIDAIKSCQGDGFRYYLQGSAMKYIWRYEHKNNPIKDLEKAQWFLNRLIEFVQENKVENNKEHRNNTT